MSNLRLDGEGSVPVRNVVTLTEDTIITSYENGSIYEIAPVAEATVNITIPDASAGTMGKYLQFIQVLAGAVIIVTASGQPLDGDTSQIIGVVGQGITLLDNTTGYLLIQDSRIADPSSTLNFYGLDEASGVSTYNASTIDINDARVAATEQLASSDTVNVIDTPLIQFIGDTGIVVGELPAGPLRINIRAIQSAGSAASNLYAEIYHRDGVGTEVLQGTSEVSASLIGSIETYSLVVELPAIAIASDETLVAKLFGNIVGGGSDPTVDIYVEGVNALSRVAVGVVVTTVAHNAMQGIQGGSASERYHLTADEAVEEGTWTPVFTFSVVGDLSLAGTATSGRYRRVGKNILLSFDMSTTPTFSTSAGVLQIKGLPYSIKAPTANFGGPVTRMQNIALTGGKTFAELIGQAADALGMRGHGSIIASGGVAPGDIVSGNLTRLDGSIEAEVA